MESITELLADVSLTNKRSEQPLAGSYAIEPFIPTSIGFEAAQVAYASLFTNLFSNFLDRTQDPLTNLMGSRGLQMISCQRYLISRLSVLQLSSAYEVIERMSETLLSKLPNLRAVLRVFYHLLFVELKGDPSKVGDFGFNRAPTTDEVVQAAKRLKNTPLATMIDRVLASASFLTSITLTDLNTITSHLDIFSSSQLLQFFTHYPQIRQDIAKVLVIFTAEAAVKRYEQPGSFALFSICLDIINASFSRFSTYDWVPRIWSALSILPFNEDDWTALSVLGILFSKFYGQFPRVLYRNYKTLLRLPTPPALPAAILRYEEILRIIIEKKPCLLHQPLSFENLADLNNFIRVLDFFLSISRYDDGASRNRLPANLSFLAATLQKGLSQFLGSCNPSVQLVKLTSMGTLHSFALLCQYHQSYRLQRPEKHPINSLLSHKLKGHYVSPFMFSIASVQIPGFNSRLIDPSIRDQSLLSYAILHLRHSMPWSWQVYPTADKYVQVLELGVSVWSEIFTLSNKDFVDFARAYAYIQFGVPYSITLEEQLIHEQDNAILINETLLAAILRSWISRRLPSRLLPKVDGPTTLSIKIDTEAVMPQ